VLEAAVRVADAEGLPALTMRRLAEAIGSEAMSLYYHVKSKDDLLDGLVEEVVGEINDAVGRLDRAASGPAWQAAVRARILTAREVLLRHPWAPQLLDRNAANPEILGYYDGLVGLMREGGFTSDQIHHALHAIGSRALGFAHELFTPGGEPPGEAEAAAMAERLPNLTGMLAEIVHDDPGSTLGWCDDQTEFEFGLDLLLDGLERVRSADRPGGRRQSRQL
jgi:AcrR family transcriptional regulator